MKASTPELMKFQRLMRRLKESKRGTIGLLEGMWLAVGKNCPRGDIGKFTNEEIAIMVDWEGDPDELIDALVECGWLDVCKVERLVVHDWNDHCPTYIKGGLTSRGQEIAIAIPYSPKLETLPIPEPSKTVSTYPSQSLPIQTKPNELSSSHRRGKSPSNFDASKQPLPPSIDTPAMREAWNDWCEDKRSRGKKITEGACKRQFRQLVRWGPAKGVIAIENAIASGWSGLFEPKGIPDNAKPPKTQAEKDAILAKVRADRAREDGRDGA